MINVKELTDNLEFDEQCFDENGYIMPFEILKTFENYSEKHSAFLKMGFEDMLAKNLLWVLARVKYKIVNFPKPQQKLKILTFLQKKNVLEIDRNFLITDSNDNVVLKGVARWYLINAIDRHIERQNLIEYNQNINRQSVFSESFDKTLCFEPQFAPDLVYQVKDSDIDKNRHMNNAGYAKIVCQALRLNKLQKIESLQINFLREAVQGDGIAIYLKPQGHNIFVCGKLVEKENCFSALVALKK